MENILALLFGKMYTGHLPQTKEPTSIPFSKSCGNAAKNLAFLDLRNGHTQDASWVFIPQSLGEGSTLNFGEHPRDVNESSLSQILEDNVPRKYYLSERACRGIIERSKRHHKKLHPTLEKALENTILWNTILQTQDTTSQTANPYKRSRIEWARGGAMSH